MALLLACAGLAACSALPSSGPTEREVLDAEQGGSNPVGFRIVDVTPMVVSALERAQGAVLPPSAQLEAWAASRLPDRIGPGDTLTISIDRTSNGPGASLPPVQVDAAGAVSLPRAGHLDAAGLTTAELGEAIRSRLRAAPPRPTVTVAMADGAANSVYVQGDVRTPGRQQMSLNERLLDVISLRGGSSFPAPDTLVEITRDGQRVQVPLRRLEEHPGENILIRPGDRIRLSRRARSFTIFGASGKVSEVPLETAEVSLAEAVARAGGPQNDRADPNAIFLFRFETAFVSDAFAPKPLQYAAGAGARPIIYRLDLMDPGSYFLAQRFAMQDKDLIYIANARTDRLQKLIGIISSVASPYLDSR